MKADFHRMPETCPEASSPPQLVQIEVSPTHPLLLLKRALPWEAITEAKTSMVDRACLGMSPSMCPWWC